MSKLEFDEVSVCFGAGRGALTAVDQVTLTIPSGRIVGLVGESGSGKSTLAKAAVGLVPLAGGRVVLDNADITRTRGRRPIQLVFQDPYSSLDPRMVVGKSIAEALPPGRTRAQRKADVGRLLDVVDLDPDRSAVLPSALSGGQRQRVALARALAADPAVVIADEITSAVDVSVQGAVLNLVRDLQDRLTFGMLFISHNLAVVRHVSDFIAVMYLGRIVESGPADDVLSDPRHPYTRTLLESAPRLGSPLAAPRALVDILDQEPPDPHLPPPGCHFHPRCPIGPLVNQERVVCAEVDPGPDAAQRAHHAACHFADQTSTELLTEGGRHL